MDPLTWFEKQGQGHCNPRISCNGGRWMATIYRYPTRSKHSLLFQGDGLTMREAIAALQVEVEAYDRGTDAPKKIGNLPPEHPVTSSLSVDGCPHCAAVKHTACHPACPEPRPEVPVLVLGGSQHPQSKGKTCFCA